MLPIMAFVLVVSGLVLRRMSAEERIQLLHTMADGVSAGADTVRGFITRTPAGCDEFYAAARARTRWLIVTPAIVIAFVTVHVLMRWSDGGVNDRVLLEWGASAGPLTTNGGWWRLLTAMFVHRGWLHLFSDVAGLAVAGALVERLTGRAVITLIFFGAGLLSGLWHIAAAPVSIGTGAASSIVAVYGLLAAVLIWSFVQRSTLTIPIAVLRGLWPGAVVFLVYQIATDGIASESMQAGAIVGLIGGLILAARVSITRPPLGRVCAAGVALSAILFVSAAPVRGIADVPSHISHVIAVEERTAARYDSDIKRFQSGRMTADELAAVAEAIGAEVGQVRTTLEGLRNIPVEQADMVRAAARYLQLREDSWRLRVDALRQGRMQTLQKASVREFEALRAFDAVVQSLPRS